MRLLPEPVRRVRKQQTTISTHILGAVARTLAVRPLLTPLNHPPLRVYGGMRINTHMHTCISKHSLPLSQKRRDLFCEFCLYCCRSIVTRARIPPSSSGEQGGLVGKRRRFLALCQLVELPVVNERRLVAGDEDCGGDEGRR